MPLIKIESEWTELESAHQGLATDYLLTALHLALLITQWHCYIKVMSVMFLKIKKEYMKDNCVCSALESWKW